MTSISLTLHLQGGGATGDGDSRGGVRGGARVLARVRLRVDSAEQEVRADLESPGGVGDGFASLAPGVDEARGTSLTVESSLAPGHHCHILGLGSPQAFAQTYGETIESS